MNSLFFIICLLAAAAACAFVFLRKKGRASALPLLVALLAVSLLAGCGSAAGTPQDTPSSDAAAPTYNIRFYFRDNLLQTQELAAGQPPAKLELSLPGAEGDYMYRYPLLGTPDNILDLTFESANKKLM